MLERSMMWSQYGLKCCRSSDIEPARLGAALQIWQPTTHYMYHSPRKACFWAVLGCAVICCAVLCVLCNLCATDLSCIALKHVAQLYS